MNGEYGITNNEIEEIVKDACQTEGILDFTTKIQNITSKGDGYFGTIFAVTVTEKNSQKKEHLIVKCAQRAENFRKLMPLENLYLSEISFYDSIFPILDETQTLESHSQNPFKGIVKCYKTCLEFKKEYLVLQNIKHLGYKMCNRKVVMTNDHIILVLKTYGRFHALSVATKALAPLKFEEAVQKSFNMFEKMMDNISFIDSYLGQFKQTLGALDPIKDKELLGKLKKFNDNLSNMMKNQIEDNSTEQVFLHGDCWCNNLLFKYKDNENPEVPTDVKFIDFQFSRLGNLIFDISYFLFTSAPKDVLVNYKKYLKIYYDSFSNFLKEFGCSAEELYPYTKLEEHYKKYAPMGLLLSCITLKNMLKDIDEVQDMVEIVETRMDLTAAISDIKNQDEYYKRIRNLILHANEIGIL